MAIVYEKKGKVTWVTLNRPEAMNSIDPETLQELSHAFVDFNEDHEAWVLILTGAGDKAFCAGADIRKLVPVLEQEWIPRPWRMPVNITRGLEVRKPVIAAVNGIAFGGGCELALASDIRIASENASFGLPEVRLGLLAGWGGTTRLARHLPPAKAAELIFTGEPMPAKEAERWGLVNQVVPLPELKATAQKWADRILDAAPLAVAAAKEVMRKSMNATLDEALQLEWTKLCDLFRSEDAREGRKAFLEKRKPNFRNA
ncbi:MAG: enoyl-CoA hydratase/isomerase family protein [Chloroflexi bacterium]|nr:enoyl-CoA hydratase/isomerase family protein [Chloroflexota bacterium]